MLDIYVTAMARSTDALLGTLDLLILKTLARGPNHGFGIALHIQSVSEGLLRVEEGSLYPALHRLERDKFVKAAWTQTENGRRARIYKLTAAGLGRLEEAQSNWDNVAKGVTRVLRYV
jgi:PadR family transcriptional regulator, regulatory protein PadR